MMDTHITFRLRSEDAASAGRLEKLTGPDSFICLWEMFEFSI